MKKLLLNLVIIVCVFNANSQTWTNFHDGYKNQNTLAITDSLIFVGGSGVINVFSTQAEYRYTKFTNEEVYSSSIDANGNVWFSCGSYVLMFDGNNWSNYRPDIAEDYNCHSVTCDKNNNLWATLFSSS